PCQLANSKVTRLEARMPRAARSRSIDNDSVAELDPDRRVIARPLPGPRLALDHRSAAAGAQRFADQQQVDAQAEIAAETRCPIVPPAVVAGLVVVQAEAVVQTEAEQLFQRVALGR